MTPVVLFCYKRLDCLKITVESLQKNYGKTNTELFIFSDGAKNKEDESKVEAVRKFIKTISGFKKITISISQKNKGLANSIIDGVTEILKTHNKVIVLEDDLLTSANFLIFMNQALDKYENTKEVFSISGYTSPVTSHINEDVYFTKRASSWGWATWQNRWEKIDWQVNDYAFFKKDKEARKKFNEMGSDLSSMLDRQMSNKLNSWAIRFCYHQFKHDLFSVFPVISKVQNIGFSEQATNTTKSGKRFATILDNTFNKHFEFTSPYINKKILKQYTKPYSIQQRIKYKILQFFI